jgi:hypothetical protein
MSHLCFFYTCIYRETKNIQQKLQDRKWQGKLYSYYLHWHKNTDGECHIDVSTS